MSVLRIEVDEIREDQAGVRIANEIDRLVHAVGVRLAANLFVDADAIEDVGDLADAKYFSPRLVRALEDSLAGGRHGEVLAIRSALEVPGSRSDERTRDDAADVVLTAHQLACDRANAPQL